MILALPAAGVKRFSAVRQGYWADNQAVATERPVERAAATGAARMAQPTYQQPLDSIDGKDRRIAQLESQVEQLSAHFRQLTVQLQEALRAGKRQAAPFAKGPPKDHPKAPSRKAGPDYGAKAHRPIPPGHPDEMIDVALPDTCPYCGARCHGLGRRPNNVQSVAPDGVGCRARQSNHIGP